jgi:transposase
LRMHPVVKLVCRGRAGAYAEAMRPAVPDAIQVADPWHLWRNLIEALEKTVIAERAALRPSEPSELQPAPNEVAAVLDSRRAEPPVRPVEERLATRTRQRWAAVPDLLAAGRSISAIAPELRLQRKRYAASCGPPRWRSCWTGPAYTAIACSTRTSRTCRSGSPPAASTRCG